MEEIKFINFSRFSRIYIMNLPVHWIPPEMSHLSFQKIILLEIAFVVHHWT